MTGFVCGAAPRGVGQSVIDIEYTPKPEGRRRRKTTVDFYLFVPGDLRPADFQKDANWFLRNFSFRSRFVVPDLSLNDLVNQDLDTNPLARLRRLIGAEPERIRRINREPVIYEFKTLLNIFRERTSQSVERTIGKDWIADVEAVRDAHEGLQKEMRRRKIPKIIEEAWRWCGEGMDIAAERAYLAAMERSGDDEEMLGILTSGLKRRVGLEDKLLASKRLPEDYRRRAEDLLYRERQLDRWSGEALYLGIERNPIVERTAEILLALAAAFAMTITIAATSISARFFEARTAIFAVLLVVIYMVKDRVKEGGRRLLLGLLPALVDDRGHHIHDPRTRRRCGRVKERVRFPRQGDLPIEIVKLRTAGKNKLSRRLIREDVIHYRRTTWIDVGLLTTSHTRFVGHRDEFVLDFRHWRYQMDATRETLRYRGKGGVESFEADRVYHFQLLVGICEQGRRAVADLFQRFRVVITRSGILRIESIGPPTKAVNGRGRSDDPTKSPRQ